MWDALRLANVVRDVRPFALVRGPSRGLGKGYRGERYGSGDCCKRLDEHRHHSVYSCLSAGHSGSGVRGGNVVCDDCHNVLLLLVGFLCVKKLVRGVVAQIRLEEGLGFWKCEMEVVQRFHPDAQPLRRAFEHVAAVAAVFRQEVEMISGHAERARKPGRPDADERPGDVRQVELVLIAGRIDEAATGARRAHRPGADAIEPSVQADREEYVVGGAQPVAARLQLVQIGGGTDLLIGPGREAGDDGKRRQRRRRGLRDFSAAPVPGRRLRRGRPSRRPGLRKCRDRNRRGRGAGAQ